MRRLALIIIAAVLLGWRFDILDTLISLAGLKGSRPARIELGSCYAYEYGYDVPHLMQYVPYAKKKPFQLNVSQEKPLWLAVSSKETAESLEEGSLHITFPNSVNVRWDKPWICLGTGNNTCYIEFNRSLHPDDHTICLEPLFVTPAITGPLSVKYVIPTKDHRATKGNFELGVS